MFWLNLLTAVRSATDANQGTEPPQATPGFNAPAMADKVLSEIGASGAPIVLIIDDLHELVFPEATEQLTALLNALPPQVHAIVGTHAGTFRCGCTSSGWQASWPRSGPGN